MNRKVISEKLLKVASMLEERGLSSLALRNDSSSREVHVFYKKYGSACYSFDAVDYFDDILDVFVLYSLKKVETRGSRKYFLFMDGEYAEYKADKSGKMNMDYSAPELTRPLLDRIMVYDGPVELNDAVVPIMADDIMMSQAVA